jgi:hypothetical protein
MTIFVSCRIWMTVCLIVITLVQIQFIESGFSAAFPPLFTPPTNVSSRGPTTSIVPTPPTNVSSQAPKNIWADPTVITAIFSAVSGVAASAASILLYFTYRKQNKLFSYQIKDLDQKFYSQRLEHYHKIRRDIEIIIGVINPSNYSASEKNFVNWRVKAWSLLHIDWRASSTINADQYNDVKKLIVKKIPDLDSKIEQIEKEINNYQVSLGSLKSELIQKVRNKFSGLKLYESENRPAIMKELEVYWFNDILTNHINSDELEPIERRWGIKYEDGIWFGGNLMCYPQVDKDNFIQSCNELIKDKSIIAEIQVVLDKRKKIVEMLTEIIKKLRGIRSDIYKGKYREHLDCCE